jgi:protoporphyrinogen oxidase
MPRCLARAVQTAGGQVVQNAEVTRLELDPVSQRVTGVHYLLDGREHLLACDECISTIPIPHLVQRATPPPSEEVLQAARHIRYKPIVIYGLLVRKPKCIDALYIYYRDRAFHRVGEPKNAGLIVEPADHTVLIVETTCEIGDAKWTGSAEARDQIIADLEAEGLCQREDLVETHLLQAETGYPIFALGFEPHLDRLKTWVESIGNLQSVGRQGGFTYPNMHSAMRMGATAAQIALKRLQASAGEPQTLHKH